MNAYRKIQLSASAVIANGMLALGLLSPNLALAQNCQLEECTTQAYCAAHGSNKYCPSHLSGCGAYIGQSVCSGPIGNINDPCYAQYAYYCIYA
jgi:hypothetical protein